jgi:hypothetical protein
MQCAFFFLHFSSTHTAPIVRGMDGWMGGWHGVPPPRHSGAVEAWLQREGEEQVPICLVGAKGQKERTSQIRDTFFIFYFSVRKSRLLLSLPITATTVACTHRGVGVLDLLPSAHPQSEGVGWKREALLLGAPLPAGLVRSHPDPLH